MDTHSSLFWYWFHPVSFFTTRQFDWVHNYFQDCFLERKVKGTFNCPARRDLLLDDYDLDEWESTQAYGTFKTWNILNLWTYLKLFLSCFILWNIGAYINSDMTCEANHRKCNLTAPNSEQPSHPQWMTFGIKCVATLIHKSINHNSCSHMFSGNCNLRENLKSIWTLHICLSEMMDLCAHMYERLWQNETACCSFIHQ